ncbi:hypothetical protein [Rubripirellula lacrimiformis]|uniref:hypothetical protein n=1 Tax=Rubripirellula lacrimiformis TaxID=1930273 RepID=UPI00119D4C78|nr:hypothetical protein [Rubripirellula lacrimiformis]
MTEYESPEAVVADIGSTQVGSRWQQGRARSLAHVWQEYQRTCLREQSVCQSHQSIRKLFAGNNLRDMVLGYGVSADPIWQECQSVHVRCPLSPRVIPSG